MICVIKGLPFLIKMTFSSLYPVHVRSSFVKELNVVVNESKVVDPLGDLREPMFQAREIIKEWYRGEYSSECSGAVMV